MYMTVCSTDVFYEYQRPYLRELANLHIDICIRIYFERERERENIVVTISTMYMTVCIKLEFNKMFGLVIRKLSQFFIGKVNTNRLSRHDQIIVFLKSL